MDMTIRALRRLSLYRAAVTASHSGASVKGAKNPYMSSDGHTLSPKSTK